MPYIFPLEAYLSRVGLSNHPAPDEDGLHALHEAQFFTIPFENFDIQLGRGIGLEPECLAAKLVYRRRGGYCFELNGLMLLALRAVGFPARPLLARVHLGPSPSGRSHQLNLVEIKDRPWVIDVGFGAGGLRCPMPLEIGYTADGPGWAFRFVERDPWGIMMQSREGETWKDSYSFDLSHVTDADIRMGNHYTSTSSNCQFVTSRVASLPQAGGRTSLLDFTLTRIDGGEKTTRKVPAGSAYLAELASTFNIELDANYDDLRAVCDQEGVSP